MVGVDAYQGVNGKLGCFMFKDVFKDEEGIPPGTQGLWEGEQGIS